MTPLADAPAPADTKRARLGQLRQLARRFTAEEEPKRSSCVCCPSRSIVTTTAESGILDGAIFVFTNGTNPETGLLLECSEKQWSFGVFRWRLRRSSLNSMANRRTAERSGLFSCNA